MTGCGCHDPAVFGHGARCGDELGPPWALATDWKERAADAHLDRRMAEIAATDQARMAAPLRRNYRGRISIWPGGWRRE